MLILYCNWKTTKEKKIKKTYSAHMKNIKKCFQNIKMLRKQEKCFLIWLLRFWAKLTHVCLKNKVSFSFKSTTTITYLLGQCNNKSMINVCQAFSLLSASRAVGTRAKHRVITSNASQQTCSSSTSGSWLGLLVCKMMRYKLLVIHGRKHSKSSS